MAELILGIPVGYFILFGGATFANIASIHGPNISRNITSKLFKLRYHYRCFSWTQNQIGCQAILAWILIHQHQIKGSSNNINVNFNGNNVNVRLPRFNKNHPFKTQYGTIWIKVVSFNGYDINAFVISINKTSRRNGYFNKTNRIDILDYLLQKIMKQLGSISDNRTMALREPEIIYNTKKYPECKGILPLQIAELLKKAEAEKEKAKREAEKKKEAESQPNLIDYS